MLSPKGLFLLLAPFVTAVLAWSSFEVVVRERASITSRIYWQERTEVQRAVEHLDAALSTILDREAATEYAAFEPYIAHPQAISDRVFATAEKPGRGLADTLYLPSPLLLGETNFQNLGLDDFYFEFSPRNIRAETVLDDVRAPSLPRNLQAELALNLEHTTQAQLDNQARKLEALVRVMGPEGLVNLASHPALNYSTPLKWSRSFTPLFVKRVDGRAPELWLLRLVDDKVRGVRLQGVWFNWPNLHNALVDLGTEKLASGTLKITPVLGPDIATAPPLESTSTNAHGTLKNLSLAIDIIDREPAQLDPWSATYTSLVGAWIVFLCSLGAIFFAIGRAQLLSERRARFASVVTHELRTPLTTLCMYAEMLEAGLVPADQHQSYYRTLKNEADRLAALVDNVLDHAGLESGRSSKTERVELGAWLRDWLARDAAAEPNTPVRLSPAWESDAEAVWLQVEPHGLERILNNLASNARRYGAAPLELGIELTARQVRLLFSDGGPGIASPETLFDAFVRGPEAADGESSSRGLGLGLSLARDLARAMGGELELISRGPAGQASESQGATFGKNTDRTAAPTTFCLTLPRAQA